MAVETYSSRSELQIKLGLHQLVSTTTAVSYALKVLEQHSSSTRGCFLVPPFISNSRRKLPALDYLSPLLLTTATLRSHTAAAAVAARCIHQHLIFSASHPPTCHRHHHRLGTSRLTERWRSVPPQPKHGRVRLVHGVGREDVQVVRPQLLVSANHRQVGVGAAL